MCHSSCPHPIAGGEAFNEQTVDIPLGDGALPAFLALPERRPASAVLLLHDINGTNDFYRDIARRFAASGYLALLPDLFFRQGNVADDSWETLFGRMQATEQSTSLADIECALRWLSRHEHATGKVGSIGFCMGGTLAMLAASCVPAPAATVAYYGFPSRERTPTHPITPSDEHKVENLQSPMLAFWGTDDSSVDMDSVDRYEAQLERSGKEIEFVRYPGIGHGFLAFDPGASDFSQSKDSWNRTLRFLDERLVRPAVS